MLWELGLMISSGIQALSSHHSPTLGYDNCPQSPRPQHLDSRVQKEGGAKGIHQLFLKEVSTQLP